MGLLATVVLGRFPWVMLSWTGPSGHCSPGQALLGTAVLCTAILGRSSGAGLLGTNVLGKPSVSIVFLSLTLLGIGYPELPGRPGMFISGNQDFTVHPSKSIH